MICCGTSSYFENKNIYAQLGCMVQRGEYCNNEKCKERYEELKEKALEGKDEKM